MPRRIVAKGMDQYADVVLNYRLAQLVPRLERCFGILAPSYLLRLSRLSSVSRWWGYVRGKHPDLPRPKPNPTAGVVILTCTR
jgi:hypothetical protein